MDTIRGSRLSGTADEENNLQIINLLTALSNQHAEGAVFTGNHSLQVGAGTSYGQVAVKVYTLQVPSQPGV